MAKIVTKEKFELEIDDDKIIGVLRNPTRKEEKELLKMAKSKAGSEKIFKQAIEIRVDSDRKDDILHIGKQYGYELVFKTILYDVRQSFKKKADD